MTSFPHLQFGIFVQINSDLFNLDQTGPCRPHQLTQWWAKIKQKAIGQKIPKMAKNTKIEKKWMSYVTSSNTVKDSRCDVIFLFHIWYMIYLIFIKGNAGVSNLAGFENMKVPKTYPGERTCSRTVQNIFLEFNIGFGTPEKTLRTTLALDFHDKLVFFYWSNHFQIMEHVLIIKTWNSSPEKLFSRNDLYKILNYIFFLCKLWTIV